MVWSHNLISVFIPPIFLKNFGFYSIRPLFQKIFTDICKMVWSYLNRGGSKSKKSFVVARVVKKVEAICHWFLIYHYKFRVKQAETHVLFCEGLGTKVVFDEIIRTPIGSCC